MDQNWGTIVPPYAEMQDAVIDLDIDASMHIE